MKFIRVLSLFLLVFLSGCMVPKVTNHPRPEWKVDFSPFEEAGCPLDESGYYRPCDPASALYALGCNRIEEVPDLFGGLDPQVPIAVCLYIPFYYIPAPPNPYDTPKSEYLFNVGGPLDSLVRYLIFVDGEFKLIKNEAEFRAYFAPIGSADEALSYVLAVRNLFAKYGLKYNWKYRYEVKALEDTRVDVSEDGYLVHVFAYQFFGCGPHYYYAVDVKVSPEGMTEEVSRTKIYRDPGMDGLCQD